jgi:hypothetical protein
MFLLTVVCRDQFYLGHALHIWFFIKFYLKIDTYSKNLKTCLLLLYKIIFPSEVLHNMQRKCKIKLKIEICNKNLETSLVYFCHKTFFQMTSYTKAQYAKQVQDEINIRKLL